MYKLLVIDDETLIADGMASMLSNCPDLNIKVEKCYSAIEALQLMQNTIFDIILTDIVMPQMNGIEFLKTIKQEWPLCYVIFLTGYGDFRYVYEAIQYPNVKYLLKAEGSKKIIEVVKDLVKSMEQKGIDGIMEDESYTDNQSLQKDIMMSILIGETQKIDSQLFELNNIPLDYGKPLQMCMIRIGSNENQSDYNRKMEIYRRVCFHLKNNLSKIGSLFLLSYDYANIVGFLQMQDTSLLQEVEERLKGTYDTFHSYNIIFVLDNVVIAWDQCSMRYLLLKRLMNENDRLEGSVLLAKDIMEKESVDINTDNYSMKDNTRDNSLLSVYLERSDEEAFFLLFDKMTRELTARKSMHDNNLLEKYYDIATICLACINRNHLSEQLTSKVDLYKLMRVDYHSDWDQAVSYLRDLCHTIFYLLNHSPEEDEKEILNKIEQYIQENLYGDLTVPAIADAMRRNASYLSRIYKKKTGNKLSDYVSERRVEEAKRLLKESNKTVHEIGDLLGYSSSSNFIRFFKKNVSLTPDEYRELYRK